MGWVKIADAIYRLPPLLPPTARTSSARSPAKRPHALRSPPCCRPPRQPAIVEARQTEIQEPMLVVSTNKESKENYIGPAPLEEMASVQVCQRNSCNWQSIY
ncbi:hypothetical protein PVAP13_8KG253801 [Panicum virgatum]|uniref:Uncharacterized protein n=1 Tax=Panicum virgatum TaxID=38727 RepID=A0A8T0PMM8_PANVG|nr:hypothetical protein PVAP13_8KG253801 [Panicum virgatum]